MILEESDLLSSTLESMVMTDAVDLESSLGSLSSVTFLYLISSDMNKPSAVTSSPEDLGLMKMH